MYKNKILKHQIVFILWFTCLASQAQTSTLRGIVSDELGPLSGVTIKIKKTDYGTTTDAEGRYIIRITPDSNVVLEFSFVGKESKIIEWKGEKNIDVKLYNKTSQLEEVVIAARPNINEIDIRARTGSVSEVNMMLIKSKPSASLGLALQGNVPGLQVINRGELGEKPQIRVRGISSFRRGDLPNEPLYILDGQTISPETFFTLNPEDIKGIKILKDAVATALYGIKAANGVLEITSTRGFNGKRTISYSMKSGITFRGIQSAKMMNSKEKLELERLLENPAAPGFLYSEKYIRKMNPFHPDINLLVTKGQEIIDSLSQYNTDWYRKLLRTNVYHTHTLSMRGGDKRTSYYTSLGFTQQGGQLKGNDYQRITGRLSLDHQFSHIAILGLIVNGGYSNTHTPNGSSYSMLDLVYKLNPYETEKTQQLYSYPRKGYHDLFNQFSREATDKTLGISASLNCHITKEIELSAVGGIDFVLNEHLSIIPPTAFNEKNRGIPKNERGKLSQAKNTTTNTSSNIRITYRKKIDKHDIALGANTDYYATMYDNLSLSGRGLYGKTKSAAAIDNSIKGVNRATVNGKKELIRNLGAGMLAGYTYNDTYDFFATYKLDASSVLPKDKRKNSAWALGGGVDLKQYAFLQKKDGLKALKLRISYGYTANLQGVSPENTVATFGYTASGYDAVRGLQLLALPNTDLRAEQNRILDYGARISLRHTDVNISFYRRTTRDALLNMPVPSSSGFLTQWRNIGILENRGLDVNVSQQLINSQNWNSRIRVNLSYNRNKVVSLYGINRLYTNSTEVLPDYEVGQAVDMIFGLCSQGINPITGEPTFLLKNGDEATAFYKFKREDFIPLGHSIPPVNGSILYHISYKNMELDIDFYYTIGGKRKYAFRYVRKYENANQNAIQGQVNDMWFKSGDENRRYPSPFILAGAIVNLQYPSTRTLGSTDMIRLNSLSFRYRLPQSLLSSIGSPVQFMTCGIQAANLFTWKRFSESDPESGNIVAPLQPVVTFSLNVSL